jgi:hypothetical protein
MFGRIEAKAPASLRKVFQGRMTMLVASSDKGKRFSTEDTEEKRRTQRKRERSFTRCRGFRMTALASRQLASIVNRQR